MNSFFFQKSDRMAILVLLAVIAVAGIVIWGVGGRYQSTPLSLTDSLSMSRQRDTVWRQAPHHFYHHTSAKSNRLFPFDPNTADARQLSRLGLKDWQVRNLLKYREAGGRFRKPSDFARLYGLTTREYERLRPYIRVHEEPRAFSLKATPEVHHRDTLRYPVKLSPGQTLSLNDADTTALRQVPGIGPVYARRIVSYRQRLGGFYRVEQLREIKDFPPSALPYFE
jgi:DNA uptake protein ComE-like DNA-binding protein